MYISYPANSVARVDVGKVCANYSYAETLHFFMLQSYVSLGSGLICMMWQLCAFCLVRLRHQNTPGICPDISLKTFSGLTLQIF